MTTQDLQEIKIHFVRKKVYNEYEKDDINFLWSSQIGDILDLIFIECVC